ncbi:MAG: prepilin peptidase [Deltaproteobacteria bacterium]|nr:prepilin peptidase [Deltaproteobacteria bacterium]
MADMLIILPFIFGAVVGSFLNVCIYRIPLGISVVSPPSRCPSCGTSIPFYYNVPIFGYVILRGRCASCKTPLSVKYPLVEALTGALAALLFLKYQITPALFIYFAFLSALVVVTFIDLKYQIIPDVISLPGVIIGLLLSYFLPVGIIDSLIGILLGGGTLFGIAAAYLLLAKTEGMGGGDIKLLAMIGAFLGWKGVIVTLLLGSFMGAFIGMGYILFAGKGSRFPIPFGPFLACGALVHLFFGDALINWYIIRATGV